MAGIGFEINKIYNKKTVISKFSGLAHSTFIAIGPTIICILMLIIIKNITRKLGVSYLDREILNSSILYAFAFSLIIGSGFTMIISRYISDKIYVDDFDSIFSSLIGVIVTVLLIAGIIGIIFYYKSPLLFSFKFLSYTMYIELNIIFILMVYVSAIKDYKIITIAFIIGLAVMVIISFLLIYKFNISVVTSILIAIDIGFFINLASILWAIQSFFKTVIIDNEYFGFLKYIARMPKLFFINFFYTFGLFGHNFVFWLFSDLNIHVGNTYITAPSYDVATFYAVLSIMPATVIFVLKIETAFYNKYKSFLMAILNGGSLKDLIKAKANMNFLIREEFSLIMEIQIVFTVLFVTIFTNFIFPFMGISMVVSELFIYIAIGYYALYCSFLLTTILLYFDIQNYAVIIQLFFLVSSIGFSYVSVLLGEQFYGLGIAVSGILTLIIAIILFEKSLKTIDYRIFSMQPLK